MPSANNNQTRTATKLLVRVTLMRSLPGPGLSAKPAEKTGRTVYAADLERFRKSSTTSDGHAEDTLCRQWRVFESEDLQDHSRMLICSLVLGWHPPGPPHGLRFSGYSFTWMFTCLCLLIAESVLRMLFEIFNYTGNMRTQCPGFYDTLQWDLISDAFDRFDQLCYLYAQMCPTVK